MAGEEAIVSKEILKTPCSSCPYRRDVPSGVWDASEYAKLPQYDASTGEQPFELFMCHTSPEAVCNGWAVCHSNRGRDKELLALRLCGAEDVPEARVPLFASGEDAARHGMTTLRKPGPQAAAVIERLQARKERSVQSGER